MKIIKKPRFLRGFFFEGGELSFVHQVKRWFTQAALLLLVCACLAPAIVAAAADENNSLLILGYSFSGLALCMATLRRWPRFTITCLTLIGIGAILQLEMLFRYGEGVNINALALISETTVDEAIPLAQSLPRRLLTGCGLITVSWAVLMQWPVLLHRWPGKRIAAIAGISLFLLLGIVGLLDRDAHLTVPMQTFEAPPLERTEALRRAYPSGLPLVIGAYLKERMALRGAVKALDQFRFGANRVATGGWPRRVHVLVIGETSRADHWGLNGYPRDTTPLLSKRTDLISFRRFYSKATFTRLSVPVILSRKPWGSVDAVFHERSVLAAAREAGYYTVWLSNQAPLGFHDSPVTALARDANEVKFVSPVDYRHAGVVDEDLLPYVEQILAADDRDLFLVIHTMGSHFRYRDRYRVSDAFFLPDRPDNGVEQLYYPKHRDYLVNGYDNSIRATDRFLNGLISRLEGLDAASWLFYVSDHGEALFDDCRAESGHGQSSPATHHVAALWWGAPAYVERKKQVVAQLQSNSKSLLSTAMVFDTLTQLADIEVPGYRPSFDFSKHTGSLSLKEIETLALDAPRCH